MRKLNEISWTDKFAPNTLSECFLPKKTYEALAQDIANGAAADYLFIGPPGIGKTSAAVALVTDLGGEVKKVNGSLNGNIDTLRTEILEFVSTVSIDGGRKYVLFDEADYMTPAAQAAFRGFRDEYTSNVSFIFTANYRNRIIEPIQSRLTEVSFIFEDNEKPALAQKLYNFFIERFEEEGIEYDASALQEFLFTELSRQRAVDIRKLISKVENLSRFKYFGRDTWLNDNSNRISTLIDSIKARNFDSMRKWVGENSDIDPNEIFRFIYDNVKSLTKGSNIMQVISIINEHQYKHAIVADPEINIVCCIAEIAVSI